MDINGLLSDLRARGEYDHANTVSELCEALTDLLEGVRRPEEIQEDTGLPLDRCQEIYNIGAAAFEGLMV